ncbi:F390 synthetase-related protein [Paenibacillus pinihumi]|uniref:F390 synthetase-related protein n=1 Tax=Paenibacillus pinihumi TaxID=669462 RepID=UPI000491AA44|nr:F390 synthetase-related protein [Paenibacillus pinihumi]
MNDKLGIVKHYVLTLARQRRRNRAALEKWQERRILRHIAAVRQASPFYGELWANYRDREWRDFPVIDKTVMMEHFDRLNTAGVSREAALEAAAIAERTRNFKPTVGGTTVGLSSGTSGSRGLFLVNPREQAAWTGTVLAKLLPRALWRKERLAFFLRANSNLYESVQSGRLQFEFFDLLDPLERHVERLNDYQAGIWVAPPSILRMLADARLAGRLAVQPHKLVGVAEVLDPLDRQIIEAAFGQPVHQAYQCTEGFLGATCHLGTMHLNEDIVHIQKEYLDEQSRRFVPIITDFSRTSQPIIRYRLNDILTEADKPCLCGSPYTAIERIEGRCDDILYFPHAEHGGAVAAFPDFITRAVIAASPEIAHYKVVQHNWHQLEVSIQLSSSASDEKVVHEGVSSELARLLERIGCSLPELVFKPYSFVPGNAKLRRVERRFKL